MDEGNVERGMRNAELKAKRNGCENVKTEIVNKLCHDGEPGRLRDCRGKCGSE